MKKTLFLTLTLALLVLLLTACGPEPAPVIEAPQVVDTTVIAEGRIVPAADVRLSFAARGTVAEILVSEGQSVRRGDVLARLADREQAQAVLAAATLELTAAQQAYDDFTRAEGLSRAQAWQAYLASQIVRAAAEREWESLNMREIDDAIEDAITEIQDKQDALKDAEEEFEKFQDLSRDNVRYRTVEDDLRKAREEYTEAVHNLEDIIRARDSLRVALDAALLNEAEAKRVYDLRAASLDPEQKALVEARLENAKAQAAAAQSNLDNYDLKAPFDGTITDVYLKIGQLVGPEAVAMQLADFSAWMVETTDLNELEVVHISEGQSVEIRPDALDDLVLAGVVEQIGLSFRVQGGDVLYTVKIKLDESDDRLRWGMTVELTFAP